ncbi:hypothetical protein [Oceanobacillus alkalisoli]|nr:hypothetical protein [Oceanobacillus alkalisoli]MCG5105382.1 hypothetical protein [Oceanobacillus alkalisoli]
MFLGWTLGAWAVVVLIPGALTAFSIIYYLIGKNEDYEVYGEEGDMK